MKKVKIIFAFLFVLLFLGACETSSKQEKLNIEQGVTSNQSAVETEKNNSAGHIPTFSGEPYVVLNNNEPEFTTTDMTTVSYELYSELDADGKCGMAKACIGVDLMPTEERGSIGQVKPTGWQTVKYDNVEGKYLYNRCHLIGFQLTGENANEKNLITGTRYMNTEGMLPFENMVADYIRETENHVMYRVTPVFEGNNLVASGVQMEAKSVEDDGEGICFNVYVFNIQPGIDIDYATGNSWVKEEQKPSEHVNEETVIYVLNTNTKKFHEESCSGAETIKKENKEIYTGTRSELIEEGYEPCGRCRP